MALMQFYVFPRCESIDIAERMQGVILLERSEPIEQLNCSITSTGFAEVLEQEGSRSTVKVAEGLEHLQTVT